MAGPSWLPGAFAGAMVMIAAYCASRLVAAYRWRRATEVDADGLHAVMGVAMAGMLVPRLSPLPSRAWVVVFALAAAWFAWQAIRAGRGIAVRRWRCLHPVPHLVECAAMLYMLVAVPGIRLDQPGMSMSSMRGPSGSAASFPALALLLTLYMLCYVFWTTDRLASLTRAVTAESARHHAQLPVTVAAVPAATGRSDAALVQRTSGTGATWHGQAAVWPALAPRLSACNKIVMGITMGYMLIMML